MAPITSPRNIRAFVRFVVVVAIAAVVTIVVTRQHLGAQPSHGKQLFEAHCAECHGADASGGKKGPNLRVEEVQQATPGSLFWVLTNGVVRRGMPVWSRLPEPQRWQLVSYIKSLPPPSGK